MGKKYHRRRNEVQRDDLVNVKSDLLLLAPDPKYALCPPQHVLLPPRRKLQSRSSKIQIHIDPEDPPLTLGGDTEAQSQESKCQRLKHGLFVIAKLLTLTVLLYIFICSLNLLAASFRLVGGKTAGSVFQQSEVLSNPIVGLMIGVFVTVIVQSSSTSSSITVSMVAAGFLDVHTAIPIIMGANIGTSITNTIVSFGQVRDRDQFERAFSGATVHDMFNWMSVIVLLPLEELTGYLYVFSKAIVSVLSNVEQKNMKVEVLSKLTKPLTNKLLQIDKSVLEGWTLNDVAYENATLLRRYCDGDNSSEVTFCDHVAAYIPFGDFTIGIIFLAVSLLLLCFFLVGIVKLLGSMLKGSVAVIVQQVLNADIPYVPWLTGYIAIVVGAVMTFLLQSSSIFTSSLTPLVGFGVISLERLYPLTLGSNLGTTTTSILAALATEGSRQKFALQIALIHMLFNLSGIIMFYPVSFMRVPILLARKVGKITAKYRWFAIWYMLMAFLVIPISVFTISLGGPVVMYCIFTPVTLLLFSIIIVNIMQTSCPLCLPKGLRSWEWLPLPLRSLKPMDDLISKLLCCRKDANSDYFQVSQVASSAHLQGMDVNQANVSCLQIRDNSASRTTLEYETRA